MTLIVQSDTHTMCGDAFVQDRKSIVDTKEGENNGSTVRRKVCVMFTLHRRPESLSDDDDDSVTILCLVRGGHVGTYDEDRVVGVDVLKDTFDGVGELFSSDPPSLKPCKVCGCDTNWFNEDCRQQHARCGERVISTIIPKRDTSCAFEVNDLHRSLLKELGRCATYDDSTYSAVGNTLQQDDRLSVRAFRISLDPSVKDRFTVVLRFEYAMSKCDEHEGGQICVPLVWDATQAGVLRCHTVGCMRDMAHDVHAFNRITQLSLEKDECSGNVLSTEVTVSERGNKYMRNTVADVGDERKYTVSELHNYRGVVCDGRIVTFRVSGAMAIESKLPVLLCGVA